MGEFLDAALSFPAVIFGAALVVVVGFWLLVLVGAADQNSFDSDVSAGSGAGSGADSGSVGFGGVPVTVSVSLLVLVAWFGSLSGTVLLHQAGAAGATRAVLAVAVLLGSLLLAWGAVRLLAHLFRRYFPAEPPPSRKDFVGRVCTIRTGSVTAVFGQAEVAAADGSTAVVQVRQAPGGRTPPRRTPRRSSSGAARGSSTRTTKRASSSGCRRTTRPSTRARRRNRAGCWGCRKPGAAEPAGRPVPVPGCGAARPDGVCLRACCGTCPGRCGPAGAWPGLCPRSDARGPMPVPDADGRRGLRPSSFFFALLLRFA